MIDAYTKLRQRLEEFAIPCVPGKGIMEFLQIVFTEQEAEMLAKFKLFNISLTVEEFARENGYSPRSVREVFYNLARRNLINYEKKAGIDYFCIQPLVVGIYEAFFSTWREQNPDTLGPAAKAIEEYFRDTFYKAASNSRSPWARIIPSLGAIEATITENPGCYERSERERTIADQIRRIGAILQYGIRDLVKKISSGRVNEAIYSIKYNGLSIAKKIISSKNRDSESALRTKKRADTQKIIDINERIPMVLKIHPYEVIRHYLDQAVTISVAPCSCRKSHRNIDEVHGEGQKSECEFPIEDTCLRLRYDDQVMNEFNLKGGHIISKEQALNILNRCEKAGLVHCSFNSSEKIEFICNCCPCCCGILGTMTRYNQKYRAFIESNFQPKHQISLCVKCGLCKQICPVHAISQNAEGFPIINQEICIGCGVCVTNCSKKALKLIKIKNSLPAIDAIESLIKFANQKVD